MMYADFKQRSFEKIVIRRELCCKIYMILAPAIMAAEKQPKKAAEKCLESVGLDADLYRIGHTKARKL
uniref:Uncharacterized protein n=1 Tax=Glossina austeni TaxID=7395 RepID=A0A1A9UDS4_GLOAU